MSWGVLDELLTVEDIAELTKASDQSVRKWMREGEMPCVRIGRRLYCPRSEFERFIDAQLEKSRAFCEEARKRDWRSVYETRQAV